MPNKNKAKSYREETRIVTVAEEYGFPAKRAYGSQGISIGQTMETDVLLKLPQTQETFRIQSKVSKDKYPKCFLADLLLTNKVDAVLFKQTDRKKSTQGLVLLTEEVFFSILSEGYAI